MYCLRCGYELRGLTTRTCPECARKFDPANSDTFASRKIRLALVAVAALASAWPLVLTLWLFLAYITAWFVLGHSPKLSGANDPKSIPVVTHMHTLWSFGFVASPVMIFTGLAICAWIAGIRRRLGELLLFAALCSWILAVVLGRWIDVWGWFFD